MSKGDLFYNNFPDFLGDIHVACQSRTTRMTSIKMPYKHRQREAPQTDCSSAQIDGMDIVGYVGGGGELKILYNC